MTNRLILLLFSSILFLVFSISILAAEGSQSPDINIKNVYISENQNDGASLTATIMTGGVSTDTTDYAPGDSVVIMGTGFWAYETITVELVNVYNPGLGDADAPWTVIADENGNFETFWIVGNDAVDQTFRITAYGESSGTTASVTFTDANTLLELTYSVSDTICAGGSFDVCGYLTEHCGGGYNAPLENRAVLFFLNEGNCGNDIAVISDDTVYTDANGLACATFTAPTTPGTYSIRLKFVGEEKPLDTEPPNSACDPTQRVKLSASNECDIFEVVAPPYGEIPSVTITDTSFSLCDIGQVCISVDLLDSDCNIIDIYSNIGQYGGDAYMFDQVARINQLGGTVTQIGGGDPGKVLYEAMDFVSPENTHSGVSVTLPDFIFATSIIDYGSFPGGTVVQSADQLIGSPTDLSFTLSGPGGPDGGDGDGSVDFGTGDNVTVGFSQLVTACNGAGVDLFIFTNSDSNGEAELIFKNNGGPVHVDTFTVSGSGIGTGIGGLTVDLKDGLYFNEVEIVCYSGSITIDAIGARTVASASTADICFQADTSGVYTLIVTAEDQCGNIGSDTAMVTVDINQAPVANAGTDFSTAVCVLDEICFGVSFSDIDNNLATTSLYSGPGTLVGNQICFTPTGTGNYTFVIKATDDCGLEGYDTVVVTVTANTPPVANNPAPKTLFLCQPEQLCYTFTATDIEGESLTWTHLFGAGSITPTGEFCFTPTGSGTYNAIVSVSDPCGAVDTTSITYNITINSPPIADNPVSPVSVFQCLEEQICYNFTAHDPNNGTLTWSKLNGVGTVSAGGLFCFTPTGAGSYSVTAVVTDSCGAADTVSIIYDVSLNAPPTVALGNDSTLFLCAPQEICLDYTVDDPQGLSGLNETMVSGYGTIDTALNRICFTPTVDGCYEFIVGVTDPCGLSDADTINVCVTFGEVAVIDCPAQPINVNLCNPDIVCQMLNISPSSATITTSFGTYAAGELCFNADTSGVYNIEVIADEACGSDTCNLVFNVTIGTAAQITCPDPISKFLCTPDNVCIPIGINGSNVSVTVSPIGTYQSGHVCFAADTSGHYEINVIASTDCGSDTCLVVADIVINSAPIAVDPVSPVDSFICAAQQICTQFSASDVDGGTLTWSRLSGNGTVSTDGLWCFSAGANSSYSVIAAVMDSCGAADTITMTYNITTNTKPTITLGNDTTIFVCASEEICLPYQFGDVDGNVETVEVVTGNAFAYTFDPRFCFTPAAEGTYQFILKVVDSCSAEDADTINVTVQFNEAPLVNGGENQNHFLCAPQELCWDVTASDADGNLSGIVMLEGPGTFDGSQICFTPDSSWCYEFIFRATDDCGASGVDTVAVCVTYNSPPVVDAGSDQTLFQCTPAQVCWPAGATDVDNNLSSTLLTSPVGVFNGNSICFTPDTSGTYSFILQTTDGCGLVDIDTALITVTINSAPVCNIPNDTIINQCSPTQVCLPVSGTDIDGNLSHCQIISGPGSLVNGQWCYTPTASQVVNVTVRCTDVCGAYCQSTFSVDFRINRTPSLSFANVNPVFLCTSNEICIDYTSSDPDGSGDLTIQLVGGTGIVDEINSQVCFTPTVSGVYTFILRATDPCGAFAQDTVNVNVTINSAPSANTPSDTVISLCDVQEICLPASCTDIDQNITGCDLTGPGTYDGTSICFTPAASGFYQFTLSATDACGLTSENTFTVTVGINSAPTVAVGDLPNQELCAPLELCLPYTPGDPDGLAGLKEYMVSGFGAIDTLNNQICFTPTATGYYEFIVRVVDTCGAEAFDTSIVHVDMLVPTAITNCPTSPIDVNLCTTDQVCYTINYQGTNVVLSTSFGSIVNGELCFNADTSGTYIIDVNASGDCGTDNCQLTFNVNITPVIEPTCPDPVTLTVCEGEEICLPVSVMGEGVTVDVSPIGAYSGGNVCFTPDTSGHYELTVTVTTPGCGSSSCTIIADVTINSAPIATDPESPQSQFLCEPGQVCYQFEATDVDGGVLVWSKLSGNGTVSSTGEWCFDAASSGSYTVQAVVTDECGATDMTSLTYVITINRAPDAEHRNLTLNAFLCAPSNVRSYFDATDPDNNILSVTSNYGTIVDDYVEFYADTTGIYPIIITATDDCGLTDADTLNINVTLNSFPVVDLGDDFSINLCNQNDICFGVSVDDIDDNIEAIEMGFGTYNNGQICFTPDTSGVYTLALSARDECGMWGDDTVYVTVDLNTPPVCNLPDDQDIFQCTPTQISLPIGATDDDGNLDHCEILSGPGSLTDGNWVYTPSTSESFYVKIMCVDDCGAECIDSFHVAIDLNDAPVVDLGDDYTEFLCSQTEVCVPFEIGDPDNNIETIELVQTTIGTLDLVNSKICFTPTLDEGPRRFIVRVTDACGVTDQDTIFVEIQYNEPPQLNVPSDFVVYLPDPGEVCFNVNSSDNDGNLDLVFSSPPGTYDGSFDQVCFFADTPGVYCMTITAQDDCQVQVTKDICVTVEIDQCIVIQVETTEPSLQGQFKPVKIYLNGSGKELGGFDLLISYDESALTPGMVYPGTVFENAGWEYFNYRYGYDGNCQGCPSGILRIIGIAETSNGAYHPTGFFTNEIGDIAVVNFLITNDRTMECQFAPIEFLWIDCGDNSLSSITGDTLWISRDVYDYYGVNITDEQYGFPGIYGAHDICEISLPGKPTALRCVDFINGGINIICADSIDARADINLNNVAYEVADAVLFSNYFVYGLGVFTINVDGQIAASDVNADGLTLSVADLVYLIRVIIGDAPPTPKIVPQELRAELQIIDDQLTIVESDALIGAVSLTLSGKAQPELASDAKDMELRYNYNGENTKVLIYNMRGDAYLKSGNIIKLNGAEIVDKIELGSYNGFYVSSKLNNLPDKFELKQNYPNPFNPYTNIEFALPVKSQWKLTIYNIMGQTVETFEDNSEAGYIKIEWDASQYASGVYFYHLVAGEFSDTRKMVLLK